MVNLHKFTMDDSCGTSKAVEENLIKLRLGKQKEKTKEKKTEPEIQETEKISLEDLPQDCLEAVASKLDTKSAINLFMTSR